jgi:hypothetical protein
MKVARASCVRLLPLRASCLRLLPLVTCIFLLTTSAACDIASHSLELIEASWAAVQLSPCRTIDILKVDAFRRYHQILLHLSSHPPALFSFLIALSPSDSASAPSPTHSLPTPLPPFALPSPGLPATHDSRLASRLTPRAPLEPLLKLFKFQGRCNRHSRPTGWFCNTELSQVASAACTLRLGLSLHWLGCLDPSATAGLSQAGPGGSAFPLSAFAYGRGVARRGPAPRA